MSNTGHRVDEEALGAVHALSAVVAALVMDHPYPDALKERLSNMYSGAAAPGGPLDLSPSGKKGWNQMLHLFQTVLGGFPVMAEASQNSQPPAQRPD